MQKTQIFLAIALGAVSAADQARAERYHCVATSYENLADDPNHVDDKQKALAAAQDFTVDTNTGAVQSKGAKTEQWRVIQKWSYQTDAVLMQERYYKTTLIDDFINITQWGEGGKIVFKRSILDGMISGVCDPLK